MAALRIPGLPDDLQTVPSWREDEAWRGEWLAWRDKVVAFRYAVTKAAYADPAVAALVRRLCVAEPKYFLTMFGWFFEPRETPLGPPDWYPWVLLPPQVQMLDQLAEMFASPKGFGGSGAWEKSRDMAATATACGLIAHHFAYVPNFTAGLVSYRESAVDDGTPGCMFFKIRATLGIERGCPPLPDFLRIPGFDPANNEHNAQMKLRHPSWTNTVTGEPTTARAGRGQRSFFRLNDEAAQFDGLNRVLTAEGAVTNHVLTLSSANVAYGPDFRDLIDLAAEGEKRRAAQGPGVRHQRHLRLDPWLHPFHDEAWFETERTTTYEHDPEGFRMEVMIDYRAGFNSYVYEEAAKRPVVPALGPLDPNLPGTLTMLGWDVGGTDQTAISVYQRHLGDPTKEVRVVDLYRRSGMPAEWYAHVRTGVPPRPAAADHPADAMHDLWQREAGADEERFMAFVETLPWDDRVGDYGDPTGGAKEGASRLSFFDVVEKKALELRRRIKPALHRALRVVRSWNKFDLQTRRFAGREVLLRLVFCDNPEARYVRHCLVNYRFQEFPEKGRLGDPKPIHDKRGESDVVTSFEYFAVHEATGVPDRLMDGRRRTVRTDYGGRKVA